MDTARRVRLFRNGRNQALRIPREFELEGREALVHREGRRLIVEPVPAADSLAELLAGWEPLEEGIDPIEDRPPAPEDFFADE